MPRKYEKLIREIKSHINGAFDTIIFQLLLKS